MLTIGVTVTVGKFAYRKGEQQRKEQERVARVEEARRRDERRDRWLRFNPLPVIYPPTVEVDGCKVRVRNAGDVDAEVAVIVQYLPPGVDRWDEQVGLARPIPSGQTEVWDISEKMRKFHDSEYRWSLAEADRLGLLQYLRVFARVQSGPDAQGCVYGTADGGWLQAAWDITKRDGGTERVELVLPVPPTEPTP